MPPGWGGHTAMWRGWRGGETVRGGASARGGGAANNSSPTTAGTRLTIKRIPLIDDQRWLTSGGGAAIPGGRQLSEQTLRRGEPDVEGHYPGLRVPAHGTRDAET